MLTTAQHKLTSAIIGAERQRSVQKWRISTKELNLSCKLQKRTAAGEDPKPHSKTLADERTCWTKASHWSESQRIHPCFSGWTSNVLGKKSSSTSKLSANAASWTTVVDALWAMFQYQIKNHMSLSAGRCASFKSPRCAECLDTRDNNVCASLHCHFTGIIQPLSAV